MTLGLHERSTVPFGLCDPSFVRIVRFAHDRTLSSSRIGACRWRLKDHGRWSFGDTFWKRKIGDDLSICR